MEHLFQKMLNDEQLQAGVPILILGNKTDRPEAASEDYVRQYFGLHDLTTGKVRQYRYFKKVD